MLFARINRSTKEVLEFPLSEQAVRDRLSSTTLPERITDFSLVDTDYVTVPTIGVTELRPTSTHRVGVISAAYDEQVGRYIREFGLIEVPENKRAARTQARWKYVKKLRAQALAKYDRLVTQALSETRQGLTPTRDIAELDAFAQKLRDMTNNFGNPYAIDERTFFDIV